MQELSPFDMMQLGFTMMKEQLADVKAENKMLRERVLQLEEMIRLMEYVEACREDYDQKVA